MTGCVALAADSNELSYVLARASVNAGQRISPQETRRQLREPRMLFQAEMLYRLPGCDLTKIFLESIESRKGRLTCEPDVGMRIHISNAVIQVLQSAVSGIPSLCKVHTTATG